MGVNTAVLIHAVKSSLDMVIDGRLAYLILTAVKLQHVSAKDVGVLCTDDLTRSRPSSSHRWIKCSQQHTTFDKMSLLHVYSYLSLKMHSLIFLCES